MKRDFKSQRLIAEQVLQSNPLLLFSYVTILINLLIKTDNDSNKRSQALL